MLAIVISAHLTNLKKFPPDSSTEELPLDIPLPPLPDDIPFKSGKYHWRSEYRKTTKELKVSAAMTT